MPDFWLVYWCSERATSAVGIREFFGGMGLAIDVALRASTRPARQHAGCGCRITLAPKSDDQEHGG